VTETVAELVDRGWRQDFAMPRDLAIIAKMKCTQCRGSLVLVNWAKHNQPDKAFTRCVQCGHRRPF